MKKFYCREYVKKISITPEEILSVAKIYSECQSAYCVYRIENTVISPTKTLILVSVSLGESRGSPRAWEYWNTVRKFQIAAMFGKHLEEV
jgi:hypothetical protein